MSSMTAPPKNPRLPRVAGAAGDGADLTAKWIGCHKARRQLRRLEDGATWEAAVLAAAAEQLRRGGPAPPEVLELPTDRSGAQLLGAIQAPRDQIGADEAQIDRELGGRS